jgi:coenzyme F420-reducing hydrogenase alpha subunit
MSKKIIFRKATRIEGNANIQIEVDSGSVKTARFLVQEFRGFEGFVRGTRVEYVPHMVSRICGLCSSSHQVASIKAVEEALGVQTPRSVSALREIQVLGEWINSHALSYFFLTMPDFVGASSGIFDLLQSHPDIAKEAFALRDAGLKIVRLLGKRTSHPVTTGVGCFHAEPDAGDLGEILSIASDVRERSLRLIKQIGDFHLTSKSIAFPSDQQINFVAYDGDPENDAFCVYNQAGNLELSFSRADFMDNISELRTDWTLAKFPYLTRFGFPAGIMLVGPLSRSFQGNSPLHDPDLTNLDLAGMLRDRTSLTLESYDACRLLEIHWAAKRILHLLDEVDLAQMSADVDMKASGQGIGVLEAPRGILMHSYLVNQGRIERMRLMVATQFNNAYINLLLRDLAEKHLIGDSISPEGEKLIGRCVRIFDPCLSCATH